MEMEWDVDPLEDPRMDRMVAPFSPISVKHGLHATTCSWRREFHMQRNREYAQRFRARKRDNVRAQEESVATLEAQFLQLQRMVTSLRRQIENVRDGSDKVPYFVAMICLNLDVLSRRADGLPPSVQDRVEVVKAVLKSYVPEGVTVDTSLS
jgi:septal ring factor EnvC (AmiA/AmiB activator)